MKKFFRVFLRILIILIILAGVVAGGVYLVKNNQAKQAKAALASYKITQVRKGTMPARKTMLAMAKGRGTPKI